MGSKTANAPASDKVSASIARKTHTRNASFLPRSSSPQSTLQPVQQTPQSAKPIGGTLSSDWASPIGLNQSEIQRASIPSLAGSQRSTKATAHSIHRKKPRNLAPARIKSPCARVAERESMLSKNGNLKIRLPRLEPTPRPDAAASAIAKEQSRAPLTTRSPSTKIPPPQEKPLPPFDPMCCHWRALRDVAFVLDGCIALSIEDLCALLRFRYAKTDPKMAGVEQVHVGAMYDFCKVWGKEMYEENAWGLIRSQMREDLRVMKDGGEGCVSWDF